MKVVLQRVSQASVTVDHKIVADIQKGLLILVGIEDADTQEDIDWLVGKIIKIKTKLLLSVTLNFTKKKKKEIDLHT